MKTSILLRFVGLLAICALFLAPCSLLAQDASPAAPLPDIAAVKGPGGVPVAAVISLLATVVTALVKLAAEKFGSKIAPAYVPFVALASSYLLDWLSHLTFGTDANWALALGAGLAAVGLNQVKKQFTADPKPVG